MRKCEGQVCFVAEVGRYVCVPINNSQAARPSVRIHCKITGQMLLLSPPCSIQSTQNYNALISRKLPPVTSACATKPTPPPPPPPIPRPTDGPRIPCDFSPHGDIYRRMFNFQAFINSLSLSLSLLHAYFDSLDCVEVSLAHFWQCKALISLSLSLSLSLYDMCEAL